MFRQVFGFALLLFRSAALVRDDCPTPHISTNSCCTDRAGHHDTSLEATTNVGAPWDFEFKCYSTLGEKIHRMQCSNEEIEGQRYNPDVDGNGQGWCYEDDPNYVDPYAERDESAGSNSGSDDGGGDNYCANFIAGMPNELNIWGGH
ncbi:hypothetical protein MRB53_039782 [Persea americana]|nr:hypothetical protein MRB53_039782 [Persea americana]